MFIIQKWAIYTIAMLKNQRRIVADLLTIFRAGWIVAIQYHAQLTIDVSLFGI